MRKRATPTALARAEHHAPSAKLTTVQRGVLDEALRRGEDLRDEVESKTLEYGRWLLEKVFANDTTAALDDKSHNPVWLELVRRAGGPTLSLRVAAADRRISAQAWRGLDVGRKEILLPLHDDKRLLAGARHVADLNLSQSKTREYVTGLLAESGVSRQSRLTPRKLVGRVKKLRASLGGKDALLKLRAMRHDMTDEEHGSVTDELRAVQDVVHKMLAALRGR
jgi:hypothetical protein